MDQGARTREYNLNEREIRAIIGGIVLAMFLGALDQTIVATALPTIGRELGNAELIPWVITGYLISATAVTPLYGKFSDIHGRRFALLTAVSVFVIGSIACAFAPNMIWLIVARAIQGLGGGGLISLAQTIVADVVSPRERGKYQAYIAGVFLTASVAGPTIGGVIAQYLHWSVIFWVNLPLGGLALWMSYTTLARLPRHERPHRLDIPGAVLMVCATVALLLALSQGGNLHPWLSPQVIGLIGLSLVFWIAFALRLMRAREPLIPLPLFANQVVRTGVLAAAFGMGTFIGLTIYMPVYYETVWGLNAAQSGFALLPLMLGTVIGATTAGRLMSRLDHYKRVPIIGLSVAITAMLVLAFFVTTLPFWLVATLIAVISAGNGTLLPVCTVAIQNAVAVHQVGTVTGAMGFFRQLGGALMVAALGAIVLGGLGAADPDAARALRSGALSADPERFAGAFAWAFGFAALILAGALGFLLRMRELPLRSGEVPSRAAPDPA
ncbi:MDR family MFS transporter [Saliniramus sp.]|uniref:MDR family MFS transporter n=1 Tax=Saliniramus sp. TaxID=2986772 RepID=UPI002C125782|nr:MDR family MFS transporter [Saliniramus sp.]HMB09470.1 MDR family MFS transporter [Saliniramus sp.]